MFAAPQPAAPAATVLCCLCGCPVPPNPAMMCANCIRGQVDITEGIQKQATVLWCKECNRYLQPPRRWVAAELESKELLTFCIKRLKGLQKVKLVDAGFVWTEPHSKRLKVKLTIQAEVLNGAILQQSFVVEYVVENHMCEACTRVHANPDQWVACVQVRQHVEHKRTFLMLEQLMLRHDAHADCIKIKDCADGMDFYFAHRSHALKLVDFLGSVAAVRSRNDKQLVSSDLKNNTHRYKFTFSTEVAPVCKDDLLCLPHKVSHAAGGLGPLVLCTRVSNLLTLTCPFTLRQMQADATQYYRAPYKAMLSSRQLVQYVVLDSEPTGLCAGRLQLAEVQVAKAADFGRNDNVLLARTHLGNLLSAGDTVLGYDVANANLVDPELEKYRSLQLPDVVLVRKCYAERRQRRRAKGGSQRVFKLRRMGMEVDPEPPGRGNQVAERRAADEERFMEELEEDREMRSRIALYRDEEAIQARQQRAQAAARRGLGVADEDMGDDDDDDDDEGAGGEDAPEVGLEELLDAMALRDEEEGGEGSEEEGDSEGDEDDDQDDDDDEDMDDA